MVVVGAQRAGTTLLWRLLGSHPDVDVSPRQPEPRWFLRDDVDHADHRAYDREVFGAAATRPPTRAVVRPAVRVEKSTTYLERPEAAPRMLACLPDVEVVAVLRDPVERALSNYWYTHRHGLEDRGLASAMTADGEDREWPRGRLSTSPYHYRRRGEYARLLQPWRDIVGARLHLLRHDQVTRPGPAIDALFARVGLEPIPLDPAPAPVNAEPRGHDDDEATVRASLARYFADHDAALATTFGVDVTGWASADHHHHDPRHGLGGQEPD